MSMQKARLLGRGGRASRGNQSQAMWAHGKFGALGEQGTGHPKFLGLRHHKPMGTSWFYNIAWESQAKAWKSESM